MDRTRMPWESDTDGTPNVPEDDSRHPGHGYSAGDAIYSGNCRGTVVSVDAAANTMEVIWSDGDGTIVYPLDASYLRKSLPWEK